MSKYSDHPAYWINKWITDELIQKTVIPAQVDYVTDLEGDEDFELPFMSAAQQSPESSTPYNAGLYKSLPFCVWTVEHLGGTDQPWSKCGNITYVFYANDVSKVIEIANLVHDLTNREDWSAVDLNYVYRNNAVYPWDFKYVMFNSGTGPAPAVDEGGRNAYMVIIKYKAVYEGPNRNGNYGAITGLGRI